MNIHFRVLARLLRNMFIPALIGATVGLIFNLLPVEQILWIIVVGLAAGMCWLFYSWTLEQIKQEDEINAALLARKNLTKNQ